MFSFITSNLLEWYSHHARRLPWRENPTPYRVWISEIMLQQTQVNTVIPYYQKWMKQFPTLESLAQAPFKDVLVAWEGLGYYQRARNLHHTAKTVMSEFGGELPTDIKVLRSLPGIGRYSAGAIASLAFGMDEPVLDGNIRRVLSRIFDVAEPVNTAAGEKRLWQLAKDHLPARIAGTYNQALMELGALVCTPKSPDCTQCPVMQFCQARLLGIQEQRPVKKVKSEVPHYTVTAAIIAQNGKVLITQRPLKGLLAGLWEFPGGKLQDGEALDTCLEREIREELGIGIRVNEPVGVYHHAYTHFKITLHAFKCSLLNGDKPQALQVNDLLWCNVEELSQYPMGKVDRKIANQLLENINDHR